MRGDTGFTLTVYGTNFITTSVVRFNGADRGTTFVSDTELTADILTADLTAVGTFDVTVFNPEPGGGESNAQTLTVSANPSTINVPNDYATIQAAIDAAEPGDTILVSPGTYSENLRITKALTVRSTDGAEETIIDGTSSYIVIISHSDVTFEGFTVTNPEYDGGADASGILVETVTEPISNVQILNNIVTRVRSETGTTPSMYGATGINIGYATTKGFTLSNIVISGNTITDIKNPDGASVDHTCGINVWDGADNVLISDNIISGIKFNGIMLEYASNVQIEENSISGCKVGIGVEPFEGATVSGLTIHHNNIVDNTVYGLEAVGVTGLVDAENNWWGAPSGPYHPETNTGGSGNAVSDNVDYEPWLTESYPPVVTPPPPVFTWPPEPYVPPVNLTEVRGNVDTILSLGEVVPAGDDPTLIGLDYNHDGMVDIADAFDQLRNAGLLWTPSFTFDPDAASNTLMALQSVYGANLENFPSLEGRVWLLYMLGYLPYQ